MHPGLYLFESSSDALMSYIFMDFSYTRLLPLLWNDPYREFAQEALLIGDGPLVLLLCLGGGF